MRSDTVAKASAYDPRETKLPAWVRDKLQMLRRATFEATRDLASLKTGTVPAAFWLESWDNNSRFYLPITCGRLMFSETGDNPLTLSASHPGREKGWLDISSGPNGLIAAPYASNVLMVKARED